MTLRIARNRPILARLVIEALGAESRRAIIAELLRNPQGLPASAIARSLGLAISTILSHLDKLVAAGIVKVVPARRGGRIHKVYRLQDREIILHVDLPLLASIPSNEVLSGYLRAFINKVREKRSLPPSFDPDDIRELLGVDLDRALMLADYLKLSEEEIVSTLTEEAREAFAGQQKIRFRDIGDRLRIHTYWAVKVARRLEELGEYEVVYD